MTNFHRRNGACIAAMRPAPGDAVVITTVAGRQAAMHGVGDYRAAIDEALTLASETPEPVKVLPMTLVEAANFCGMTYEQLMADMNDEQWRDYCARICIPLLNDPDPKVRADATELLTSLGAMPQ